MNTHFPLTIDQLRFYLKTEAKEQIIESFEQLLTLYQLQQARLEALLDTVNEAVCIIDEADKVVVWNRHAELLYGIAIDEIIGRPIEGFFSNLMLTKVMKERRTVHEQYHTPCPDTHVLINARPVKLAGQVIGGVCAERDITEVVQLNQKLSQTHQEVQTLKQEIDKIHSQSDSFSTVY
ncbi:MAG: modulated sigma54 specific transcriptional regulator, Fis family, partial [Pelosinus sp.]|nr:modulated sigma54 specific transcriptional regulator, Fis family [Pelosinus sp.]